MRLSCLQALGVFLIAMCGPARAEFYWHEPAFSDVPLRGPERAHGALIYSHGRGTVVAGRIVPGESHYAPPAPYVRFLLESGWDAFKLNRKYVADREPDSARALEAEIGRLRALGYRRIVLAGQSYGAWLSVLVATRDNDIHAVIATAPGTGFGNSSIDRVTLGAQKLLDFVEDIRSTRVAFFFFAGDELEATGRGEQVARRLSARRQYHWVVDRPADLWGHNAARTGLFTRRYVECLARLIAPDPPPDLRFACDTTRGLAAGSDIPMPADAGLAAAPPGAPPALAPFIGRWLGEDESGVIRRLASYGDRGRDSPARRLRRGRTALFDTKTLCHPRDGRHDRSRRVGIPRQVDRTPISGHSRWNAARRLAPHRRQAGGRPHRLSPVALTRPDASTRMAWCFATRSSSGAFAPTRTERSAAIGAGWMASPAAAGSRIGAPLDLGPSTDGSVRRAPALTSV